MLLCYLRYFLKAFFFQFREVNFIFLIFNNIENICDLYLLTLRFICISVFSHRNVYFSHVKLHSTKCYKFVLLKLKYFKVLFKKYQHIALFFKQATELLFNKIIIGNYIVEIHAACL